MASHQLCQYESLWNLFPNKPTSWRFQKVGIKLFECMECKVPDINNKGNLYQYLFDRNSDCFCLKISEWDFSVLYVISLPPLFQVSSTEKAGISFVFFFGKTSFYAVCFIKKQNLSCCMRCCVILALLPPCLSRWTSEWDFRLAVSWLRIYVLFWNASWPLSDFLVFPTRSADVRCILNKSEVIFRNWFHSKILSF